MSWLKIFTAGQMAIRCNNINQLLLTLRENGDKILDASSKLSLSATLLYNLNESLGNVFKQRQIFNSNFHVIETEHCDLEFVYDFIQKTLALKMLPDASFWNNERLLDIKIFRNLRLLEIQRLSLNLIKGIKSLRAQLEYLTCIHSLHTLGEILENCGADNSQGFVWRELKEAVFSYNSLNSLDNSLEFAPWLHTLDLSHNCIQNAQLLNCLPNLKHLNISYNQLESVPTFSGQLCNHLQVLVLHNNFIEDIRELTVLVNLRELDLSNNCLLEHTSLLPLVHLSMLKWLSLIGNPLSFHPRHRLNTAYYLNLNVTMIDFILDGGALSKAEKQVAGSLRNIAAPSRTHLDSLCSTGSESTVIPARCKNASIGDTGVSSDMDTSLGSVATVKSDTDNEEEEEEELPTTEVWLQNTLIHESIGMQDSGIVAGRRPLSPSESSIGSATSLASDSHERPKHCESDIEVLSNPSQSSIEVIGTDSGNIRLQFPELKQIVWTSFVPDVNIPSRLTARDEWHLTQMRINIEMRITTTSGIQSKGHSNVIHGSFLFCALICCLFHTVIL